MYGHYQRRACSVLFSVLFGLIAVSVAHSQAITGIRAARVAANLDQPLFVTAPSADFQHLYIVTRTGLVQELNLATGLINPTPLIDVSSEVTTEGERGLLGMAFDPNYASNGTFYLNYVAPGGAYSAGVTHISRFSRTGKKKRAHLTETVLLSYDQLHGDHNGGWIGFSPRSGDAGNLYIASGDGGCCNDQAGGHIEPGGNSQSTNSLLGKILRIHVPVPNKKGRKASLYKIPAGNPFALTSGGRSEVWAWGLRNPFRASFDRLTGDLYIGDVGQDAREEVDLQPASKPDGGENYGWRPREGIIATPTGNPVVGGPEPAGAVDPLLDYPHSTGRTVIGGYVYRGKQIPALYGRYLFGDFVSGKIFILDRDAETGVVSFHDITAQLFPTSDGVALSHPASFGEDANGELYVADIGTGNVFKIVASTPTATIERVAARPNGHNLLRGFGIPFQEHTIQAAMAPGEPFISIGSVMAEGDGHFVFDDPNAKDFPGRVYRVLGP